MLNEKKRLHVYLEKPARVDIEMCFHWKQIISLSFDREIHLGTTSFPATGVFIIHVNPTSCHKICCSPYCTPPTFSTND